MERGLQSASNKFLNVMSFLAPEHFPEKFSSSLA